MYGASSTQVRLPSTYSVTSSVSRNILFLRFLLSSEIPSDIPRTTRESSNRSPTLVSQLFYTST